MADINQLKAEKVNLVKQARSIIDDAEKRENKELTPEEKNKYDGIFSAINKLTDRINQEEQLRELERKQFDQVIEPIKPDGKHETREAVGDIHYRDSKKSEELFRALLSSEVNLGREAAELRALQVDSNTAGGYIVAPMQFVNTLIQAKDNLVFMRRLATKYSVPNADSLGAPSLDNDPADPAWTSELNIGTEDSTMSFGRRELHPHPLAKYIKVSNTLLRKAMMGADTLVRERLAYKFAVTEESNFMTGNGSGKPLGVFTASDNGISTSRDVSTGNTTTELRTDNLLECKYTLKQQYRMNCQWIWHRDSIKMLAKLKDGEGRYIWQPAITAGTPDRLLGYPVNESEYAPNTFTTGLYLGILGDFSYYWIADALDMTIQKLVELYAATNQTGFIGRLECDGMPVHENAFVRAKLA